MELEQVISAVQLEAKFANDSCEGNKKYRKGYVAALERVAEFLEATCVPAEHDAISEEAARLLSFSLLSMDWFGWEPREFVRSDDHRRSCDGKERRLTCPACRKLVDDPTETESYARERQGMALTGLGSLTCCEGCGTILEYCESDSGSLTLRVASPERVELFHRLATDNFPEYPMPELIELVTRYWQASRPIRSSIGQRFEPMRVPFGHRFK